MIFEAWQRAHRFAGVWILAAAAAACSGPSEPIPLVWLGHQGDGLPASVEGGVFSIQAQVNGAPAQPVLVDTGAPFTMLDVDAFGGAVPLGAGRVATLTFGGTILWKPPTFGVQSSASVNASGGILGFDAFGQFPMSFNYRDKDVVVGEPLLPPGLLEPTLIPMTLEGGGLGRLPDGTVIDFAASRIILTASIEGAGHILLLDTGASSVALRSDIFQALISDGRGRAQGTVNLVTGDTPTTIARLRSVAVASASVTGPTAVAGTGIDDLLTSLTQELGHPIDGLLGAPFLQHYFVTVHYPSRQILFRPYTTDTHIVDPYTRVGITLRSLVGATSTTYQVRQVVGGSDAERKGVMVGETLLAIDGIELGGLPFASADDMLLGAVGFHHTLQFATRTLVILVDDLLPLP